MHHKHTLCSLVLCSALLMVSSCDNDVHIEYGISDSSNDSINGTYILKSYLTEQFGCRLYRQRSTRLDACDIIFHAHEYSLSSFLERQIDDEDGVEVEGQSGEIESKESPAYTFDDSSSATWIRQWLTAAPQRQCVLFLRDGDVTQQLGARWIQEFENAAKESDNDERAQRLHARGQRLRDFIQRSSSRHSSQSSSQRTAALDAGVSVDYELFTLTGIEPHSCAKVQGVFDGTAPMLMHMAAYVTASPSSTSTETETETLIGVDGKAFALSIPIGDSRLIVMSNTTPFLDASLVDHQARMMLAAFSASIARWRTHADTETYYDDDDDDQPTPRAAWLQSLDSQREYADEQPNILVMLFTKKPFNYIIIHGFILLFAFLLWKSCWLGKRTSQRQDVHKNFGRHIEALAWNLRNQKKNAQTYSDACQTLARYHNHDEQRGSSTALHAQHESDAFALCAEIQQHALAPAATTSTTNANTETHKGFSHD